MKSLVIRWAASSLVLPLAVTSALTFAPPSCVESIRVKGNRFSSLIAASQRWARAMSHTRPALCPGGKNDIEFVRLYSWIIGYTGLIASLPRFRYRRPRLSHWQQALQRMPRISLGGKCVDRGHFDGRYGSPFILCVLLRFSGSIPARMSQVSPPMLQLTSQSCRSGRASWNIKILLPASSTLSFHTHLDQNLADPADSCGIHRNPWFNAEGPQNLQESTCWNPVESIGFQWIPWILWIPTEFGFCGNPFGNPSESIRIHWNPLEYLL